MGITVVIVGGLVVITYIITAGCCRGMRDEHAHKEAMKQMDHDHETQHRLQKVRP